MHQRRTIRDGFATSIVAAETPAETRVYPSRVAPADVESLVADGPIVLVYTPKDVAKKSDYPASMNDGGVKRCLTVMVEVIATGKWVVDDTLDDFADQIEGIFENWEPDSLPAAETRHVSTEIGSSDEFQVPVGGILMEYEVDYWRPFRTATGDDATVFCPSETFVKINGGAPELVSECDADTCHPVTNIALPIGPLP